MKLSFAGARAQAYDRNPAMTDRGNLNTAIAPHGVTNRWTYTVPANTLIQLTTGFICMERVTAAAPVSTYVIQIVGPNGNAILQERSRKNAVGDHFSQASFFGMFALAGDQVIGQTFDNSTGGTIDYSSGIGIVQFDI